MGILKYFLLFLSPLLFLACSDSSKAGAKSDPDPSSTVIVAVDGYIKDATLKDSTGQSASYTSSGGKYTFSNSITYPITLSGGLLEETEITFDVTLSAQEGELVISPITTFLENDTQLLEKLVNANLGASTLSEFAVDYIVSANTDMAKFSQIVYMVLKDTTLTQTYKNSIKSSSATGLYDLYILAKNDVDSTMGGKAFSYKLFLDQVRALSGDISGYEEKLQPYKEFMNMNSPAQAILKTGQTTSYTDRDDGYYQSGTIRSFEDNGDGTVSDLSTGLLWQKEDDNSTYNFSEASDYCAALNLGSSSSWRVPTIDELIQLSDKGQNSPAIDPVFTDTQSSYYWSSTDLYESGSYAWYLHFKYANRGYSDKTQQAFYVRCVSE